MILIGDTHNNSSRKIANFIDRFDIKNEVFVHVGDWGIGINSFEADLHRLDKDLAESNCKLFINRGNHDDPSYWDNPQPFTNIIFPKDYSVHFIDGSNVLFIGGAVSIDRKPRREILGGWFENEGVKHYDETLNELRDIHRVVSHSAPHFAYPQHLNDLVLSFAKKDETLVQELIAERNLLTNIYDILIENNLLDSWFYGHFHEGYSEKYGYTIFKLMAAEEFLQI